MPEARGLAGMTQGKPEYYASAVLREGHAQGVLVGTREGRPIKIEGNPAHPSSLGATDPLAQGAVLDLWDPDRSQSVMQRAWPQRASRRAAASPRQRAGTRSRPAGAAKRHACAQPVAKGLRLLTGTSRLADGCGRRSPAWLAALPQAHAGTSMHRCATRRRTCGRAGRLSANRLQIALAHGPRPLHRGARRRSLQRGAGLRTPRRRLGSEPRGSARPHLVRGRSRARPVRGARRSPCRAGAGAARRGRAGAGRGGVRHARRGRHFSAGARLRQRAGGRLASGRPRQPAARRRLPLPRQPRDAARLAPAPGCRRPQPRLAGAARAGGRGGQPRRAGGRDAARRGRHADRARCQSGLRCAGRPGLRPRAAGGAPRPACGQLARRDRARLHLAPAAVAHLRAMERCARARRHGHAAATSHRAAVRHALAA